MLAYHKGYEVEVSYIVKVGDMYLEHISLTKGGLSFSERESDAMVFPKSEEPESQEYIAVEALVGSTSAIDKLRKVVGKLHQQGFKNVKIIKNTKTTERKQNEVELTMIGTRLRITDKK